MMWRTLVALYGVAMGTQRRAQPGLLHARRPTL